MTITDMFKRLGAPLTNPRWSWGGVRSDGTVVLRVWQNETKKIDGKRYFQLTHRAEFEGRESNLGNQERADHVARIVAGARCHMVMCEPKDTVTVPRTINDFNKRETFLGGELIEHEGDFWVEVAARELADWQQTSVV